MIKDVNCDTVQFELINFYLSLTIVTNLIKLISSHMFNTKTEVNSVSSNEEISIYWKYRKGTAKIN